MGGWNAIPDAPKAAAPSWDDIPSATPQIAPVADHVPEPPPFHVDRFINEQVKHHPPEKQVETKSGMASTLYQIAQPWMATGYTAAAALNRGMAHFYDTLNTAKNWLAYQEGPLTKVPGFKPTKGYFGDDFFENAAKGFEANADYWKSRADKVGVPFIDEMLGEGIGGALPGMSQFILEVGSGFTIPYAAGEQKARESGEHGWDPVISGLVEAAKTGTLAHLFRMAAPYNRYIQSTLLGGTFAAQSAAEAPAGERAKAAAKGFGIGVGYGLTGENGNLGVRDIYPEIGRSVPEIRQQLNAQREAGAEQEQGPIVSEEAPVTVNPPNPVPGYAPQVVSDALAGKVPSQSGPTAYILGGGTASGKTTLSRPILQDNPNAVLIDPDRMKLYVPRYEELKKTSPETAAMEVHSESKALKDEVLKAAVDKRLDVVYDTTSSSADPLGVIQRLKDKGYKVVMKFSDVPIEEAMRRGRRRAESSNDPINRGRFIPQEVYQKTHSGSAKNFFLASPDADEVQLYDNSGKTPELIYERIGQQPGTVYNEGRYQSYRRKAGHGGEEPSYPQSGITESPSTPQAGTVLGQTGTPGPTGIERGTGLHLRTPDTATSAEILPQSVAEVPTQDIKVDPNRFQFRITPGKRSVSSAESYNPDLSGILNLWKDPQTGETFVVNGHHRVELANRFGVEKMLGRYVQAPDAKSARAVGAMINIAEGSATPTDAAKLFRDLGIGPEELKSQGIGLSGSVAEKGLDLSKLSDPLFQKVVSGAMTEGRGAAIGRNLDSAEEQDALVKLLDSQEKRGKKLSDTEVSELARFVKSSGTRTESEASLFGTQQIKKSNAIEKARLSARILDELRNQKLFGTVAKKAEQLKRGGNVINAEESARIANEAAQTREVYDRLSGYAGPISDLLNEGADRIAKGGKVDEVAREIVPRITEAVKQQIKSQRTGSAERVKAPEAGGTTPAKRPSAAAGAVEPALPGMEQAVREQQAAAGTANAERIATEFSQPGTSIESSAGEMERKSPLFRDTEANPQQTLRMGPGHANLNAPLDPDVGELTQILKNIPKDTSFDERQSIAEQARLKYTGAMAGAKNGLAGIKSTSETAWNWYKDPPKWTEFDDIFGKFQGAKQKSGLELERFGKQITDSMPERKQVAMTNYMQAAGDEGLLRDRAQKTLDPKLKQGYEDALTLTEDEKSLSQNIRAYWERKLDESIQAGILDHGIENYVMQAWAKDKDNPVAQGLIGDSNSGKLSKNPAFAKKRIFESYFEGEQAGKTPKDKRIGYLISAYQRAFDQAIATRQFVTELSKGKGSDGRPLVLTKGGGQALPRDQRPAESYVINPNAVGPVYAKDPTTGKRIVDPETGEPVEVYTGDYKTLTHPALRNHKWVEKDNLGSPIFMQGDVKVHPEVYRRLDNFLGKSLIRDWQAGRIVLRGNSEIKGTLLGFFSPFHQVHLAQTMATHGMNPLAEVLPNKIDLDDPIIMKGMSHGLLLYDRDGMAQFSAGVETTGLERFIPFIGKYSEAYQQYLFGPDGFVPRMKAHFFKVAYDRNLKRYPNLSDDQVAKISADQSNASFGGQNYEFMGRNKTLNDALRITFLAPNFLESRAKSVGQALRPYGKEQFTALAIRGALGMYVAARIAEGIAHMVDPEKNKVNWDRPFAATIDGKEYSLRSEQGDFYHLLTDPRSFVYYRLSPGIVKPAIEAITGRDNWGRKKDFAAQLKDWATASVPIAGQGFFSKRDYNLYQSILQSIGVSSWNARTEAEKVVLDIQGERNKANLAPVTEERMVLRSKLRKNFSKDQQIGPIIKAAQEGKITVQDVKTIIKGSMEGTVLRGVTSFPIPDALKVWAKATDEEKQAIQMEIIKKWFRWTATADERAAYEEPMKKVISWRPPKKGKKFSIMDLIP